MFANICYSLCALLRFSLGADLHGHGLTAVIGGEEEHFEDFGESNNTSDLLLANHEEESTRPGPEGAGDPEPLADARSPNRCAPVLSPRCVTVSTCVWLCAMQMLLLLLLSRVTQGCKPLFFYRKIIQKGYGQAYQNKQSGKF